MDEDMNAHADGQRITSLLPLPKRALDGHKGIFGTVAIIGGCAGMHHEDEFASTMIGAPALAALGAIRSGCGLVKVASPAPIIESVLTLAPFATGFGLEVDHDRAIIASSAAIVIDELVRSADVVVVGPGLGSGAEVAQMVMRLISQEMKPTVLDADALNALSTMQDFARDVRCPAVLTPHPGEAKRLMAALSIEGDPAGDQHARTNACTRLAQRIGCIVVLKGKGTVVSDGYRVWVCERGHPAMGVGGTGDVLSGAIGSIIAQSMSMPKSNPKPDHKIDLFNACVIAVQAHAIAGENWAKTHSATGGMIASELADELVGVIESMRK